MAVLLKNVENSIWHAFNSLAIDKNGTVQKSKLKVLTANIGTLLDLHGVEKGLEHFRSTSFLNFDHYMYYIQKEVFSSLPDTLPLATIRDLEEKINEVCWLVCKKAFLNRDHPIFPDHCVYKLFRIFCLLAEQVSEIEDVKQVVMHASEVGNVASQFVTSLGLEWDKEDFNGLSSVIGLFKFPIFLAVLESKYALNVDEGGLVEAIQEIYDIFIKDVLKKGYLLKKGDLLPTFREHWFVLQPMELSYYKNQDEKEQRGGIALNPNCWVEATHSNSGDKIHRFVLSTTDKNYELATYDHRTRLQWLSAFQIAISNSANREGYQRGQFVRRRSAREAEVVRQYEEHQRRTSQILDMEQTRAELEAEKVARVAAEAQARELEAQHKEEERRLQELEDIRLKLEKLLEEETQAKRDEEIVRNLQARVLREEWEKRDELEQLQEEQRLLLEEEREKRKAFEKVQRENESRLQEAERKLRKLEEDRMKLDKELQSAQEKILLSERSKEVLEAKLRVREREKVHRTLSFMPSTKERPAYIQPRSNSMRQPRRNATPDEEVNNNSSDS